MKKKMTLKRARMLAPVVALAAMVMVGCAPGPGPTPPPWLAAGCITSSDPLAPDFSYSGTPNVFGNGLGHVPSETPCGGDVFDEGTIVAAATVEAAAALCATAGDPVTTPSNLVAWGYAAPWDAWACAEA